MEDPSSILLSDTIVVVESLKLHIIFLVCKCSNVKDLIKASVADIEGIGD